MDRRLGEERSGPTGKSLRFGRACVRERGDRQAEMSLKRRRRVFPFPFCPREAFPFPLASSLLPPTAYPALAGFIGMHS